MAVSLDLYPLAQKAYQMQQSQAHTFDRALPAEYHAVLSRAVKIVSETVPLTEQDNVLTSFILLADKKIQRSQRSADVLLVDNATLKKECPPEVLEAIGALKWGAGAQPAVLLLQAEMVESIVMNTIFTGNLKREELSNGESHAELESKAAQLANPEKAVHLFVAGSRLAAAYIASNENMLLALQLRSRPACRKIYDAQIDRLRSEVYEGAAPLQDTNLLSRVIEILDTSADKDTVDKDAVLVMYMLMKSRLLKDGRYTVSDFVEKAAAEGDPACPPFLCSIMREFLAAGRPSAEVQLLRDVAWFAEQTAQLERDAAYMKKGILSPRMTAWNITLEKLGTMLTLDNFTLPRGVVKEKAPDLSTRYRRAVMHFADAVIEMMEKAANKPALRPKRRGLMPE